jgi:hypothetical protein
MADEVFKLRSDVEDYFMKSSKRIDFSNLK